MKSRPVSKDVNLADGLLHGDNHFWAQRRHELDEVARLANMSTNYYERLEPPPASCWTCCSTSSNRCR
jgi:hypothetical protein